MKRLAPAVFALLVIGLCLETGVEASKRSGRSKSHHNAPETHHQPRAARSKPAPGPSSRSVARDRRGRIQRSDAARHAFARRTGFPNGRKGYVIDHIVPLACGGADVPGNMQWQTIAEAKAKDRTERTGCR